jgi:hypothetical protein
MKRIFAALLLAALPCLGANFFTQSGQFTASGQYQFQSGPFTTPGAPVLNSPANAATGQVADVVLSWSPGSGGPPEDYDVYFGTSATPPLVSSAQTGTTYTTSATYSTTYYWNILARNAAGTATSSTYSFTTLTPVSGTALVTFESGTIGDTGSTLLSDITNAASTFGSLGTSALGAFGPLTGQTVFENGYTYQILTVGNINWTSIGDTQPGAPNIGDTFVYNNVAVTGTSGVANIIDGSLISSTWALVTPFQISSTIYTGGGSRGVEFGVDQNQNYVNTQLPSTYAGATFTFDWELTGNPGDETLDMLRAQNGLGGFFVAQVKSSGQKIHAHGDTGSSGSHIGVDIQIAYATHYKLCMVDVEGGACTLYVYNAAGTSLVGQSFVDQGLGYISPISEYFYGRCDAHGFNATNAGYYAQFDNFEINTTSTAAGSFTTGAQYAVTSFGTSGSYTNFSAIGDTGADPATVTSDGNYAVNVGDTVYIVSVGTSSASFIAMGSSATPAAGQVFTATANGSSFVGSGTTNRLGDIFTATGAGSGSGTAIVFPLGP